MVKLQQNFIECEKKTELIIFNTKVKKYIVKLKLKIKIKLNCKRFYLSKSVKYLGIKINETFNWKQHIHDVAIKLNIAYALLSITRNYLNKHTLRTTYFAIFDSHINYANPIWGQKPRVELSSYKKILNKYEFSV